MKEVFLMAAPKITVTASPAAVRSWAESEGLIGKGQRGKMPRSVIESYNKCHGVKHAQGKHVKTITHKVLGPKGGVKAQRVVNVESARAAAKNAGVKVGERGVLPKSVLDAYVLGTLSSLVAAPESE